MIALRSLSFTIFLMVQIAKATIGALIPVPTTTVSAPTFRRMAQRVALARAFVNDPDF
jgi:hypothetical protein